MDDTGPLFNVRMKRGQGYNSYIEEVRIENAVTITRTSQDAPSISAAASEAGTVTPDVTKTDPLQTIVELLKSPKNSGIDSPDKPRPLYSIQLDPNARYNQTVTFSTKQVKTVVELNNAMGFNASAAIKASSLGPGAETRGSLATKDDLSNNDVNFLVHVTVLNEAEDRQEEWSFNEVAGLKHILGNDDARDIDEHQRSVEFTRIYGDCFISDFVEGGEIYAWIGIKSQNRKDSRQLAAHASAHLAPTGVPVQVSGESNASRERSRLFSQATTSIRIQWRGGGQIKNYDFLWGMDNLIPIANAFPSMVAARPAKIRAVLTPYTALKSFQDHRLTNPRIPLPLTYDHCAIYTSTLYEDFIAFQDLCDSLNDMIKDPRNYHNRDDKRVGRNQQATQPEDPPGKAVGQNAADHTIAGIETSGGRAQDDTRALTDLARILKEDPRHTLVNMDPDPQKLSILRLLCRSSMIYIQEQAAKLVIDPDKSITKVDDKSNLPFFVLPKYICPGVVRSILPVENWDSSMSDFLVKQIADLDGAEQIVADPANYWCDVVGEPLSPYRAYEHFAIGNFDLKDDELPQKIAVKTFSPAWYHSKRIKDQHNSISGIGLSYTSPKARIHSSTKTMEGEERIGGMRLSAQERATTFCNMYVGRRPAAEQLKTTDGSNVPLSSINYVDIYYRPGEGRIAGLEFKSGPDPAGSNEGVETVFIHKAWDPEASLDRENGARMQAKMPKGMLKEPAYPGWGMPDQASDYTWTFAGLIGAFEKVGAGPGKLNTGRVLARVAIVWKKKPGNSDA